MKVSGFTFVRNGVKFDYPVMESLASLLPLVDELVIVVGKGEDETLARVQALAAKEPKLKVFESVWDEKLRKDGAILAQQTDVAISHCTGEWGLYLQADEVLHEDDYPRIRAALEKAHARPDVDGLLFDYVHFYGDFFVVNRSPSAYRHEVRAIRLKRNIISWRDAQGFRRDQNGHFEKLRVLCSHARIFHYGWVRPPEVMREKTVAMDKLYHPDGARGTGDNHQYKRIYGLERFTETHPRVMLERVEQKRWKVDLMAAPLVWEWKDARKVLSRWVEKATGHLPFQYRNYVVARD
ncbi:MAG: glycosyltransferase family 2 protein [Bdellovibrionota bacterium]